MRCTATVRYDSYVCSQWKLLLGCNGKLVYNVNFRMESSACCCKLCCIYLFFRHFFSLLWCNGRKTLHRKFRQQQQQQNTHEPKTQHTKYMQLYTVYQLEKHWKNEIHIIYSCKWTRNTNTTSTNKQSNKNQKYERKKNEWQQSNDFM